MEDYYLLQFAPNGFWLPVPLNIDFYSKFRQHRQNKIPVIIHYPANLLQPSLQDNHSKALESLQRKGKCKVVTALNIPHEQLMHEMANADIVIGKIRSEMGWFGKFELEGMALGKPVMAYISDELYNKYKPPIYRTTKETLEQDIEHLIEEKNEQQCLSKIGMEYGEQNHDMIKVTAKLKEYYYMA